MNENTNVKKLRRTRRGRVIAGVCSGVGDYIGVDANIIRIALAIATFFGGLGVGIYAIGWLLLPDEDKDSSIVQDLVDKQKSGQAPWQQHQGTSNNNHWSEPVDAPVPPPSSDQRPQF
ncbi:PspC domain-containing protein [Streptosporangium soli]|nr:PspC domain-containing protein [Streptosporangium sp. KLBMP 9127]